MTKKNFDDSPLVNIFKKTSIEEETPDSPLESIFKKTSIEEETPDFFQEEVTDTIQEEITINVKPIPKEPVLIVEEDQGHDITNKRY
jgi:hypothetical protein